MVQARSRPPGAREDTVLRSKAAFLFTLMVTVLALAGCGAEPALPLAAAASAATPPTERTQQDSGVCVADGGFDDTLDRWSCCSGIVVPGTVVCIRPEDHGGTWDSCLQVCGTRVVGGCVPPGGIDDKGESTHCCSGRTITGSTRCLNPADFGTNWKSCVHLCA